MIQSLCSLLNLKYWPRYQQTGNIFARHLSGYSKIGVSCIISLPLEKYSNYSDSWFTLLIATKKLNLTLENSDIHRT